MKYSKYILFLLFICFNSFAEITLEGTWQSDKEQSLVFLEEHTKIKDKQKIFLSQILGEMTITYNAETVVMTFPTLKVVIDGKKHNLEGFNETSDYKVIFKNKHSIATTSYNPWFNDEEITIYHFVNPNLMWVYSDNSVDTLNDLHFREYFKRIK